MTTPADPRADGAEPQNARPHAWVVEWGAVSLPIGHPSRVTSKSIYNHRGDAERELAEVRKEFDAHMYEVAPVVHSPAGGQAYRCIAPLCEPLGCSMCNCALPADVYAAVFRARLTQEQRSELKRLADAVESAACDWAGDNAGHGAFETMEAARTALHTFIDGL